MDSRLERAVRAKLEARKAACKRRGIEQAALEALSARIAALEQAQSLAQHVAQGVQTQAHRRIAEIVSRCLRAVFAEPYVFQILFERKRGKTEARLVFRRDGLEIDPLTAAGGGVVDVAAFALRVACLLLSRPALRRLLILDEPFRFVSGEYRERVRQLLESMAKELAVQIVMVTHDPQLHAGELVDLGSV